MNKSEMIAAVAKEGDMTQAAAAVALDAVLSVIQGAVARGDQVALIGFGKFEARARAARKGQNPKTGEVLNIAATVVPAFSAGAGFKALVAAQSKKK